MATSTAASEYIALATAAKEAKHLQQLLGELQKPVETIQLMEDNTAAISMAKNPVFHQWQKHIDVQFHFVREEIESGRMAISYTKTEHQIADILTKPLTRERFIGLKRLILT